MRECSGVRERSEQCGGSKRESSASERADKQVAQYLRPDYGLDKTTVACSITYTHLLAPHCLLRSRASLRSFAFSLTRSRAGIPTTSDRQLAMEPFSDQVPFKKKGKEEEEENLS